MGGQIFDQKPCSQPGLLGGIFHEADIAFRYVFLQLQLEDFLALQRHMGEGFRDKADSQIGADAGKNEIRRFLSRYPDSESGRGAQKSSHKKPAYGFLWRE